MRAAPDLKVEGASKTAAEPHLLLAVATDARPRPDLPGSGTPAEPYFAQLLSMADEGFGRSPLR
jgi:hypothetical protein